MLQTFRAAALAVLLLIATGCASRLDGAVLALNGAQSFIAHANDALAASHRAARDAAADTAPDVEAARRALAEVHARYLIGWRGYEAVRMAWIATAATVRAAQAIELAGGDHDPHAVTLALLELGAAYEAFRRAALALAVKAQALP